MSQSIKKGVDMLTLFAKACTISSSQALRHSSIDPAFFLIYGCDSNIWFSCSTSSTSTLMLLSVVLVRMPINT